MAQIVLPVAGAIVSTALGMGPAIGWAVGSILAAVFFPPDGVDSTSTGPRLSDLKVSNADYGAPIPLVFGTVGAIAGSIIWATDLEEVRTENSQEVGGKGGPSSTVTTVTYSYYASFAVLFGEGPATELLRVWADNKLIYDSRRVPDEILDLVENNPSNDEIVQRALAAWVGSNKTFSTSTPGLNMRFYQGTEDQELDPAIVADKGELANANNGMVYLVFDRLPLANFGNRIPNITAEIVFLDGEPAKIPEYTLSNNDGDIGDASGAGNIGVNFETGVIYKSSTGGLPPVMWPHYLGPGEQNFNNIASTHLMVVSEKSGLIYTAGDTGIHVLDPETLDLLAIIGSGTGYRNDYHSTMSIQRAPSTIPGMDFEFIIHSGAATLLPGNNTYYLVALLSQDGLGIEAFLSFSAGAYESAGLGAPTEPSGGLSAGGFLAHISRARTDDFQSIDTFQLSCWEGGGVVGVGGNNSTVWNINRLQVQAVGFMSESPFLTVQREGEITFTLAGFQSQFPELNWPPGDIGVRVMRLIAMDKSTEDLFVLHIRVESLSTGDGLNTYFAYDIHARDWVWAREEQDFNLSVEKIKVTATSVADQHLLVNSNTWGSTFDYAVTYAGGGASIPLEDRHLAEYDMQTGELITDYAGDFPTYGSGAGIDLPESLFYTYDTLNRGLVFDINGANTPGVINFRVGEAQSIPVQSILDNLSERVGLEPGIFLETTPAVCKGFYTTGNESIKDAIARLGTIYKFNVIESDFALKVKNLSDTPDIINIPEADLIENSDEDILRESRIAEMQMPQAYSLTYIEPTFEYQPNTVTAKVYNSGETVTGAKNIASSSVAVVLDKDEAKQLAETLLESAWQERWGLECGVTQRYIAVEPTDFVHVATASASLDVRVASCDLGINFKLDLRGTSADSSTYLSNSTTDGNLGYRPPSLESSAIMKSFILNTPLLRDGDANGILDTIYHAGSSYNTGNFIPIQLQYSESGESYVTAEILSSQAPWGYVISDIPHTDLPFTPDPDTVITLRQVAGEAIASVTDDELLTDYANAIAVFNPNAPGDIEIIQFRDVTPIDDTTYDVSYLLRGRRGTETMQADDPEKVYQWVLLNLSTVRNYRQPTDKLYETVFYRTIPIGESLAKAEVKAFESRGNSLKPYAPVNIDAIYDGTDIEISWMFRNRINGALNDGVYNLDPSDPYVFEVVIVTGSGSPPTRTFTAVSTSSVTYTNAEILADFGSIPDELYITIYQSSVLGFETLKGFSNPQYIEVQNV